MLFKQPIQNVFVQLTESLNQLTNAEYSQPGKILFNASIGQHVRHILELFLCLENGYISGVVNYEKRKRDYKLETDKNFAIQLLKEIYHRIERPYIFINGNRRLRRCIRSGNYSKQLLPGDCLQPGAHYSSHGIDPCGHNRSFVNSVTRSIRCSLFNH